ncbi:MAG: zinc ribbon domain-containing protein [Anaerolineales bacterium]|nr:zinc ribbon domain-containing protein [Anaerolineales bacterium]
MPTYEFKCLDCPTVFKERRTFARANDGAICPGCQSERTQKVLGTPMVFSSGGQGEPSTQMRRHGGGCFCCPPGIRF